MDNLQSESANAVILHAFDGDVDEIGRGVALGFYFSVPPCFARSEMVRKSFVIKNVCTKPNMEVFV